MKFIAGKKVGMSQIWKGNNVIPVTMISATPNTITQVKTVEKDGYVAIQIGFGTRKEKNISKPQKGHMKGLGSFAELKEFRLKNKGKNTEDVVVKRGDKITVATFNEGDVVKVTGTSKGKGFQGVVKRHGFSGHYETHGTKDQVRTSGSIGAKGVAHVFKGTRMGGRMGNDTVTMANLEIVKVDAEKDIIYLKGSVAGAKNGMVYLVGEGDLVTASAEAPAEEAPKEDVPAVAEAAAEEAKAEEAPIEEAPAESNN